MTNDLPALSSCRPNVFVELGYFRAALTAVEQHREFDRSPPTIEAKTLWHTYWAWTLLPGVRERLNQHFYTMLGYPRTPASRSPGLPELPLGTTDASL